MKLGLSRAVGCVKNNLVGREESCPKLHYELNFQVFVDIGGATCESDD